MNSTDEVTATPRPASTFKSTPLKPGEVSLMLGVAFVMLRIDPPHFARKTLAGLCTTVSEVFDVVVAMRDSPLGPTGGQFAAGLRKGIDNAAARPASPRAAQ